MCTRVCVWQGPGTDSGTVDQIRDAIKSGSEITVRILNYTKQVRPAQALVTLSLPRIGMHS
jgi:hypothetical protein